MLQSKDLNLDKEISLVLIMALRTDRQYLAARFVWALEPVLTFINTETQIPFLAVLKRFMSHSYRAVHNIHASLYSACCPSFLHHSFYLFLYIF